MIEVVGILGAILLALCGLPELIRSYRRKYCDIGWGFLGTWMVGELLVLVYVLMTSIDWILVANYGGNILIISGLIYYKIRRS